MIYRKISIVFVMIALAILTYSCGSDWKISDRMEGFKKNSLRVYVRIDAVRISGEEKTKDEVEREIILSARGRCAQFLKSHIRKTLSDREKVNRVIMSISTVLESSRIRYRKCYDTYCEAFVDFNIGELEKRMKYGDKGESK